MDVDGTPAPAPLPAELAERPIPPKVPLQHGGGICQGATTAVFTAVWRGRYRRWRQRCGQYRRKCPCADCALDCPASHPKVGRRHEAVELRKGPPPPHRRLERAKSQSRRVRRRWDVTGPRNRPWGPLTTPTTPLTPADRRSWAHPAPPFDACPSRRPR